MTPETAARFWNGNADAWTLLVRAGHDVYRDHLNTPAFLAALPPVRDLHGLDLGCGEGHHTRLLAARGARMLGLDVAPRFIAHARATEVHQALGIDYLIGDAIALPLASASLDFVIACMSLMDVPQPERALAEVRRVLKPGGFVQLSISHPCFQPLHRRNLRGADGRTYAFEVGGYFEPATDEEVEEWLFGDAPAALKAGLPKFRIPRFRRTLAQWFDMLKHNDLLLEHLAEPRPDDHTVAARPALQDAQVVAYFLHLRARKPA